MSQVKTILGIIRRVSFASSRVKTGWPNFVSNIVLVRLA